MRSAAVFGGFVGLLTVGCVVAVPSEIGASSKSFAGSNNYFLHGLPAEEQQKYIQTLAGWGVKMLRLWVTNVAAGCHKGSTDANAVPALEDSVGSYNTKVLDALDNTLKLLAENGIKTIISPHNANGLNGSAGCDAYCTKYSVDPHNFYSSANAKADYDKRIATILNYQSPNFNKPWKELSNVIYAFDLQNEPMITVPDNLQNNDPDDWLCGRAGAMRKVLGDSKIKIATGGIGGSQYCCDHEFNLLDKALRCDALDIMSVHGYMNKASDWAYFITGDKAVVPQANQFDKLVMVEEWGVSTDNADPFNTQVKVFNDAGMPWLYWQVVPGLDQTQPGHPDPCSDYYDGFEIGLSSSKGDVKSAVAAANAATAQQDWSDV